MTGQFAATFAPPSIRQVGRADGAILLSSRQQLGPPAASVWQLFLASAGAVPDRVLAAERHGDGWQSVTYAQARATAGAIAQGLIDRGAADRPVMVLSGNSLQHLLLTLACHAIGTPVVPVSTAYSLLSDDHARLRALAGIVQPAAVFADDPEAYGPALSAVAQQGSAQILTPEDALGRATVTGAVAERCAAVGPDSLAKILFTSGSTGLPKGVLTTHRMLCSNQQMLRQIWPFLQTEPPVLLDWLPWSHTFGGSHNLNLVLANAGTLYIDDGRPGPLVSRTLRNLAEVRPTVYFNVPAGYAALVPALEADRALAGRFFDRLRFVFFAASALPQDLWSRIGKLAAAAGRSTPMTTSWGATETAPGATSAHFPAARSDCIGVPLPGVQIKLARAGERLEIRVRGPNVTPGYFRDPAATAAAFDAEGFYRTGDAVVPVDPAEPNAGLRFDGRIAENFKLSSGTWVNVGTLRPHLLGASRGLIQDAAITGHDRDQIGALAWLNLPQLRRMLAAPADLPDEALRSDPRTRAELAATLARASQPGDGSSRRIERLLVLAEPASMDAGEITDKGYVNQRAVLRRRAHLVRLLHASPPGRDVILRC